MLFSTAWTRTLRTRRCFRLSPGRDRQTRRYRNRWLRFWRRSTGLRWEINQRGHLASKNRRRTYRRISTVFDQHFQDSPFSHLSPFFVCPFSACTTFSLLTHFWPFFFSRQSVKAFHSHKCTYFILSSFALHSCTVDVNFFENKI